MNKELFAWKFDSILFLRDLCGQVFDLILEKLIFYFYLTNLF